MTHSISINYQNPQDQLNVDEDIGDYLAVVWSLPNDTDRITSMHFDLHCNALKIFNLDDVISALYYPNGNKQQRPRTQLHEIAIKHYLYFLNEIGNLTDHLTKLPELETLTICLDLPFVNRFQWFFDHIPMLKRFFHDQTGQISTTMFIQRVMSLPKLTNLTLEQFIDAKGAKIIAHHLPQTHLHRLCLANNPLGNDGVAHIMHVMRNEEKSISDLDLSNTNCGDIGAHKIAQMLQTNHSLKYLNLGNNDKITEAGLLEIVKALKVNTTLERIDLTGFLSMPRLLKYLRDNQLGDKHNELLTCNRQRQQSPTSTSTLLHKLKKHCGAMAKTSPSCNTTNVPENKKHDKQTFAITRLPTKKTKETKETKATQIQFRSLLKN